MSKEDKYYYKTHLEVVLKGTNFVFGLINISHIPYEKLEEMFMDQVTDERFLFDDSLSYSIDKKLYKKHKVYLDKEIPFTFDFKLFDYSVGFSGNKIEKLKKWYYEELPPYFSDKEKS